MYKHFIIPSYPIFFLMFVVGLLLFVLYRLLIQKEHLKLIHEQTRTKMDA